MRNLGFAMARTLMHTRNDINTDTQRNLPDAQATRKILSMAHRTISIEELIKAAAKPYRELWRDDQELNLNALSRHYKKKGHPVSQATFSRAFAGIHGAGDHFIEATHYVFKLPKSMLRGEPLSAEMDKLLTDYKLSTLLLAQKIESLPKDDYYVLVQQIERALENAEKLREAAKSGGAIPFDRHRRA